MTKKRRRSPHSPPIQHGKKSPSKSPTKARPNSITAITAAHSKPSTTTHQTDDSSTSATNTPTITSPNPPSTSLPTTHPRRRDTHRLHCPAITYLCATGAIPDGPNHPPCLACAYKIGNFDITRDVDFVKRCPNQRPEMCPRSDAYPCHDENGKGEYEGKRHHGENHETMGYQRGMSVLTVGDGDFTFALAVARMVVGRSWHHDVMEMKTSEKRPETNDEACGFVMATSYEDADTLHRVYPDFEATLQSLRQHSGGRSNHVKIGYNVDATKLQSTLPKDVFAADDAGNKHSNNQRKFHRICWNFPCTAIGNGKDGQNQAMEENKELVRQFMISALPFLDEECGEIHMAHKTKPPYNHWGLETVAMEGVHQYFRKQKETEWNAGTRKFEFRGKVVFDKCALPPYTPRKALDRKSFPCHDACVYVFGWNGIEKHSNSIEKRRFRSTITKTDEFSSDIPNRKVEGELPVPSSVIPVTVEMIDRIRAIHLRHADQIKPNGSNRKRGQRNNDRNRAFLKRHKASNR